ncbi:SemiSWEET transporter [Enterovibrio calviensis]|uniref:SemiSWEET transporter n=1 Tax=Enterovibrio calviensis TaxID=91359 RepID=UPI000484438C|nr:SemiSWEET transporter [Enterovibrio calviensis]
MSLIDRVGKALEPIMLAMGLISPLATLPQIYKLYFSHSEHAAGLSLITWLLYACIASLWTVYGLYHKNPTIWVGNGLGFIMYVAMVIGIVIHTGITL